MHDLCSRWNRSTRRRNDFPAAAVMRRRSTFTAALLREGYRFRACCVTCDWHAQRSTVEVEASLLALASHRCSARQVVHLQEE